MATSGSRSGHRASSTWSLVADMSGLVIRKQSSAKTFLPDGGPGHFTLTYANADPPLILDSDAIG